MNVSSMMRGAADMAHEEINAASGAAKERGADLADAAKEKASAASDAALREISNLLSTVNEKMRAMGVDADILSTKAKSAADIVEKSITREVTERPLRALAIAGLIGLAIGAISRK